MTNATVKNVISYEVLPVSTATPTTSTQLITKAYGDSAYAAAGSGVSLGGTNAWTGTNTYNTNLPTSTLTPSSNTELITKLFADTTYGALASIQTWSGVNTFTPQAVFTNSIKIPLGAGAGKVLGSDSSGNGTWVTAGVGDVTLAGANAFTGTNTFDTNLPTSTQTPTTSTQLTTKGAADATYIPKTPADPGLSYTGTIYSPLIGTYTNNNILLSNGTIQTSAVGINLFMFAEPELLTLNLGSISIATVFAFTSFTALTSFTAASLEYIIGTFNGIFPLLTTFSLPNLKAANTLSLTMPLCTTFSVPSLIALDSFNPTCAALTTLTMPSLTIIEGNYNPVFASLTSLTLANLVYITGNISGTMPLLTTLSLPALLVAGTFTPTTYTAITTLSMPLLTTINGAMTFGTLANLTSLTVSALTTVSGALTGTLAALTSFSMANLVTVTGALTLTLAGATSVTLTNLSVVTGAVSLTCATLTSLTLPAITSLGSTFAIVAANMTSFSMNSGLLSVGGNFTMSGMKLDAASVNGILVRLAALDGTGGTTTYSSKTVNLSGGTSAAPSGAGATAKTTLQGRGCTVTTN